MKFVAEPLIWIMISEVQEQVFGNCHTHFKRLNRELSTEHRVIIVAPSRAANYFKPIFCWLDDEHIEGVWNVRGQVEDDKDGYGNNEPISYTFFFENDVDAVHFALRWR